MAKPHVLVVMGYGCHLDTPLGWIYLPRVARFVREQDPDYVIFCGGLTQRKTAPGISEAWSMNLWVIRELGIGKINSFLVNNSYNSLENIQEAAKMIRRLPLGPEKFRITIFCEATRAPGVIWLARRFMLGFVDSIDDITVETASWERADPFKQVWKMIYNWFAVRIPYLARRERRKRIKRAEQI
jgi:hypothetical protein